MVDYDPYDNVVGGAPCCRNWLGDLMVILVHLNYKTVSKSVGLCLILGMGPLGV
jgi:hypothetical protein